MAISHLCSTYPTWASWYCSSATTLQDLVLSSFDEVHLAALAGAIPYLPWTSSGCCASCMDIADAAEIIYSHLQHVHVMMDLLEGGAREKKDQQVVHGLRNARIFDYVARDEERRALLDSLTAFALLQRDVERQYDSFWSVDFALSMVFVISDFKMAIGELNATVEYEQDPGLFTMPKRRVVVDDILRKLLDGLVNILEYRFKIVAMSVPSLSDLISQVHSHGQQISDELEAEIPRVREAYENIPWWQSVAPIEMLGEGTQRRVFTSYHEFLEAKAVDIRDLVERAAIVNDNFRMLGRYFSWYMDVPPTGVITKRPGRVLTVARLLEVVEDLEYRISSIGTGTKMPRRRFTCTCAQLP